MEEQNNNEETVEQSKQEIKKDAKGLWDKIGKFVIIDVITHSLLYSSR